MERDRFVIWGIGERGKEITELISKENIAVYVDRSGELQGKQYKGITIISPETYEKEYKDYPIIVTPEGHEEDIVSELRKKGVRCFFTYRDSIDALLGYFVLKEYIVKQLQKVSGSLYLYGISPMALLLNDILIKQNQFMKMIADASASAEMKQYISDNCGISLGTWEEAEKDSGSKVILTKEVQEGDLGKLNQYHGETDDYHNLTMREELFYYPEIAKLKGIHAGKRCFIVATGPSLRMEDLERLRENREICISVNSIFKAFVKTKWRPDYYVIGDMKAVRMWKDDVLQMDVENKFVADTAWIFDDEKVKGNIHKWHVFLGKHDENEIKFSANFARGGYCGRTIVYDGALQMAAYMGFSEIYLLGTDMSYLGEADKHYGHFYEEKVLTSYGYGEVVLKAYETARRYAKEHNIKIYNATRGGKLEVFERVDFDTLF